MLDRNKNSISIQRWFNISVAVSSALAILFSFQNCSPMGEAIDSGSVTGLSGGPGAGVIETGELGNTVPTITVTSPLNGSSAMSPADVAITVQTEDSDGKVQKVEFWIDGTKVGEDVDAPFQWDQRITAGGIYSIYAYAHDNSGGIASSESVVLTVTEPVIPVIDPCLPANGYVPVSLAINKNTRNIDIGMRPRSYNGIENLYNRDNTYYTITGGTNATYGGVNRDVNCNNSAPLDVDCNNNGFQVQPNDTAECVGGSKTINIVATDTCGGRSTGTITVNYTNVCWNEKYLAASDPQTQAALGSRVAISGNHAVASAPGRGGNNKIGAAYVFEKTSSGWDRTTAILEPSTAAYTEINAVAISGDLIAIASRSTSLNNHTGRIYLYEGSGNNWNLIHTINGPTPTVNPNDVTRFGMQVAIDSADRVIVGADTEDWGTSRDAGAVYVFSRSGNTWSLSQRLQASNGGEYHNFGRSLAVSGSLLVIGAPMKSSEEATLGRGYAYVFRNSGGTYSESNILRSSTMIGSGMQYGSDVATDGTNVVVGAEQAESSRGRAYLYTPNGSSWSELELKAADVAVRDYFGRGVAIANNKIYVSAPGSRHNGAEIGATFQMDMTGNILFKMIPRQANRDAQQNAGSDIGISGNTLIMGSEAMDDGNTVNNSGAAYFITVQ
ncbi:MAG: hypothetical protein H6626_03190 [Pseudobdellovibrionaceae bacterium]|nr:MAG: hypothetical protein H6626_03190 [Pseudobdellovibrionaceae bacterium]